MYRIYQCFLVAGALACLLAAGCAGAESDKPGAGADDKSGQPTVKIEDLKEGMGEPAKLGDWLEVHYTGWLTDGTKFDSSLDRQQPIKVRLGAGQVIKGWEKGLEGMKLWGKRKLTIPPELAYGSQGRPNIPPNSTLIFEVELVGLK